MDNKSQFLLGQKIWCILDLSNKHFTEGIINSEKLMSEYGRAFYKVSLNDDTFVNVFEHNIFKNKAELFNYIDDLINSYKKG